MVLGLESVEHFLEVLGILVIQDGGLRGETVSQSVGPDGGASFGSLGAGALLRGAATCV